MEIYEFDIVALLFFSFGIYAIVKERLDITLSVGPSGYNTAVDENHPDTKSKEIHLGPISCRLFGISLIVIAYLIYANIKGDLAFVI